jgi:hypothetical protein
MIRYDIPSTWFLDQQISTFLNSLILPHWIVSTRSVPFIFVSAFYSFHLVVNRSTIQMKEWLGIRSIKTVTLTDKWKRVLSLFLTEKKKKKTLFFTPFIAFVSLSMSDRIIQQRWIIRELKREKKRRLRREELQRQGMHTCLLTSIIKIHNTNNPSLFAYSIRSYYLYKLRTNRHRDARSWSCQNNSKYMVKECLMKGLTSLFCYRSLWWAD